MKVIGSMLKAVGGAALFLALAYLFYYGVRSAGASYQRPGVLSS